MKKFKMVFIIGFCALMFYIFAKKGLIKTVSEKEYQKNENKKTWRNTTKAPFTTMGLFVS